MTVGSIIFLLLALCNIRRDKRELEVKDSSRFSLL